jgi:hypothetical protein
LPPASRNCTSCLVSSKKAFAEGMPIIPWTSASILRRSSRSPRVGPTDIPKSASVPVFEDEAESLLSLEGADLGELHGRIVGQMQRFGEAAW